MSVGVTLGIRVGNKVGVGGGAIGEGEAAGAATGAAARETAEGGKDAAGAAAVQLATIADNAGMKEGGRILERHIRVRENLFPLYLEHGAVGDRLQREDGWAFMTGASVLE